MFVDRAYVCVKAGRGGDGTVAWRREKYVRKGGPVGGDGGNGGSVIVRASSKLASLGKVDNITFYRAPHGQQGGGKCMKGRSGKDLYIDVPLGTLIRRRDDPSGVVLSDMTEDGQEYVLAAGGKGGYGNRHFASPINRAPYQSTKGEDTDEQWFQLELKLIAEVGLIGMPNAGKSSIIRRLTRARPKVADYPFTTLRPYLGTIEIEDGRQVLVADIPGLIEGAHEGVGLGLDFLRHVERTKLFVHVLDIHPLSGPTPDEAYAKIRLELAEYSPLLMSKPELIVANKVDLCGEGPADALAAKLGKPVIPLSAVNGHGLKFLVGKILAELELLREKAREERSREEAARLAWGAPSEPPEPTGNSGDIADAQSEGAYGPGATPPKAAHPRPTAPAAAGREEALA